jgi:hypothetical protein
MRIFLNCHSEQSEELEFSGYLKFRKSLTIIFFFNLIFILHSSSFILAQHTRLYACALGSNDSAASMGGSSIGGGLWQSDDTGKTWRQLGWKHVKCYSVDVVNTSDGKVIYQACGNGVLKSTDAGVTWKMMTDWRMTEVMDIAVDQKKPNNIYIVTPGAIWKSDDGGENWYEADTDIPQPIFVSRVKIDPSDHLKIYAATELGLYESKDGGLSWKKRSGSGESVRDMIISSHGLSAWIEESGRWIIFTDKKWAPIDLPAKLWTLSRAKNIDFFGGRIGVYTANGYYSNDSLNVLKDSPKNVHSLVVIGNNLLVGSLNGGVSKYDLSHTVPDNNKLGLDNMQIWRLKAIEIK